MDIALGLCVGVALAAACGFRVFVPLLVLAIGARAGFVSVGHQFEFLASWPALVALSVATVVECVAALWPWLDHALDVIATPCAVVAGTLVTASQVEHMHPLLMWATGLVAGGGAAGLTQVATVSTRGVSTFTTAGLLNPFINLVQTALATVLSVLAILVPVVAGVCVLAVVGVLAWWWVGRSRRRTERAPGASGPRLTYVDAA